MGHNALEKDLKCIFLPNIFTYVLLLEEKLTRQIDDYESKSLHLKKRPVSKLYFCYKN